MIRYRSSRRAAPAIIALVLGLLAAAVRPPAALAKDDGAGVVVGPAYDTTHVYVAPDRIDALVTAFTATFGGKANPRIVTNVLPVPASTQSQAVLTPAGNLSVFAFLTPVPYPFGQERNGILVTDMDKAVKAARDAGAEVIVAPFQDPIGRDAVVQWPGGVKMQLYWHFKQSVNPPLGTVPEMRVYVSPDRADEFVKDVSRFARGKKTEDDRKADAAQIGRPGETFRRIRIDSDLGVTCVFVTDGHLPYPYGHETTGYQVADLDATLAKAKAAGAMVLSGPVTVADRATVVVSFPGGYVAEIHASKAR